MSDRWRDKKGEPGFEYHAWMRTVDELEDQIADLVAAMKEARGYLECCCEPDRSDPASEVLAKFDDAIAKAEAQP